MEDDVLTILAREYRIGLLAGRSWYRPRLLPLVVLVLGLGVALPAVVGIRWIREPWLMFFWLWLPVVLCADLTSDAFGPEEPDRDPGILRQEGYGADAVLFGKMGYAVSVGFIAFILVVLFGAVTVNILYAGEGLALYPGGMLLAIGAIVLLLSELVAGCSVLLSLYAPRRELASPLMRALVGGPFLVALAYVALQSPGRQGIVMLWISRLLQVDRIVVILVVLLALDLIALLSSRSAFGRHFP